MPAPVLLRIDIVGAGSILIDPRVDGYTGLPAESLPLSPGAVHVETHPLDGAPPPSTEHRYDLDAVLWHIGEHSFGSDRATWLWPGDRYQLTRWPRVTRLTVDLDSIKMFAALGAAAITVDELAGAAEVSRDRAQRAVNALSLMSILTTPTAATPAPHANANANADAARLPQPQGVGALQTQPRHATEKPTAHGLFGRLRRTLGL